MARSILIVFSENAFIRVVQSTVEDVLYEALNNKIHRITDNARDKFLAQGEKTIKYNTYENTGIWNYKNSQYWIAYNGEFQESTKGEYLDGSDDLQLRLLTKI